MGLIPPGNRSGLGLQHAELLDWARNRTQTNQNTNSFQQQKYFFLAKLRSKTLGKVQFQFFQFRAKCGSLERGAGSLHSHQCSELGMVWGWSREEQRLCPGAMGGVLIPAVLPLGSDFPLSLELVCALWGPPGCRQNSVPWSCSCWSRSYPTS